MIRRTKPYPITEDEGPYTYVYTAVTAVPGIELPDESDSCIKIGSFPEIGAEAFLTKDWDKYCLHLDRSNGLGGLLLTAFRGSTRFSRISVFIHNLIIQIFGAEKIFISRLKRETNIARKHRHKKYGTSGCYLVYQASGDVMGTVSFHATRRFGGVGFGLSAFSGEPYRACHRKALNSSVTALSLALVDTNCTPDTHFIGDDVFLKGSKALNIYSRTVKMGTVSVVTSQLQSNEKFIQAESYIPLMLNDNQITTAISLFVQSQKKEIDNLRSFITSWSALELLVNNMAKLVRPKWEAMLLAGGLPDWDKDLKGVSLQDYRMRDRFFSVVCVLDLKSAKADTEKFIGINKIRSEFYHQMTVSEDILPSHETRLLFRKYLKLRITIKKSSEPE